MIILIGWQSKQNHENHEYECLHVSRANKVEFRQFAHFIKTKGKYINLNIRAFKHVVIEPYIYWVANIPVRNVVKINRKRNNDENL